MIHLEKRKLSKCFPATLEAFMPVHISVTTATNMASARVGPTPVNSVITAKATLKETEADCKPYLNEGATDNAKSLVVSYP